MRTVTITGNIPQAVKDSLAKTLADESRWLDAAKSSLALAQQSMDELSDSIGEHAAKIIEITEYIDSIGGAVHITQEDTGG